MEIRHLRAFIAVSDELHFRRAADQLPLSQSALSKQIRALEDELGEKLFLRTRHGVRPTAAGAAFLEHAKAIVRTVEVATRAVSHAAHGRTGRLEVGFCEGMEIRTIPRVLRRFRKRYPGVDLRLHPLPSPDQAEGVRSGAIDLGFVHLPVPGSDLAVDRLGQETLFLAAPESHRLARLPETTFAELQTEPFILIGRQHAPVYHDLILSLARERNVVLAVHTEARNFHDTLSLVAGGLGVSLIPSSCRELSWKGVAFCTLKPNGSELQTGIICRKGDRSELVENFLDVARSAA